MTPFSRRKKAMIEKWETAMIAAALNDSGGCVSEAARLLGLDRSNLHRMMKKYKNPAQKVRVGN